MTASGRSCACAHCGARCSGRFAGCGEVWARGPLPEFTRPAPPRPRQVPPALRAAPPAPAPRAPLGPAPLGVGDGHERSGVAFVAEHGASFSLDSLKVALDGLGREVGRLSRRLDEQGGHEGASGSEALVNGAIRVVLEELSALTSEIRAERVALRLPEPEPGVRSTGTALGARFPDPSPEPPLDAVATDQYSPVRGSRRNGWGWRAYR